MTVLGLLCITLAKVIKIILDVYTFIVLGAVFISWFRPDPYNPIVRFITQVTEPVFSFVRKRLPAALNSMGMDFTPIVVFIVIIILDTFLVGLLFDLGTNLRMQSLVKPVPTTIVDTLPQL